MSPSDDSERPTVTGPSGPSGKGGEAPTQPGPGLSGTPGRRGGPWGLPLNQPDAEEGAPTRPAFDPLAGVAGSQPGSAADEPNTTYNPPAFAKQAAVDLDAAPVGWLVVVRGAGRGSAFALRRGTNRIGRGNSADVPLAFGDVSISREDHARLTYEPRRRTFFLQPGGGRDFPYLLDSPVLAPVEIESGAEFELGRTTLRFIALCSPAFDWSDPVDQAPPA